jgi:hypothetical protein
VGGVEGEDSAIGRDESVSAIAGGPDNTHDGALESERPVEPSNGANPKLKIPPSEPTIQWPSVAPPYVHAEVRRVELLLAARVGDLSAVLNLCRNVRRLCEAVCDLPVVCRQDVNRT